MGGTSAAALWLVTRGAVLWLFLGPESWVTGDVAYFAGSLAQAPERGLAATLVEYPLPGVAVLAVPWLVAGWVGGPDLYPELVLVLGLVADAAFAVLLHRTGRAGRAGRDAATAVWLLGVPLLGATAYARFDLVPGILAGTAVLTLLSHPRVAAAAVAAGAGFKLWPALLLPALAARRATRPAVLVGAVTLGTALAVGSVALAGWARLVSPFTWQAGRGLQIESVLATPAMLAWATGPGELVVGYSAHNAFEVSGPAVPELRALSDALTVLVAVGLLVLWVRAWRRGADLTVDAVVWSCLAAVSAVMVTSRVLSPQYLLWLLPVAAAGLAVVGTGRGRHRLRRWSVLLLAATALTHLVFPVLYGGLITHGAESFGVVLLLAARNALLVWLAVRAAVEAWWHLLRQGGPQRGSALDRHPAGPSGSDARSRR